MATLAAVAVTPGSGKLAMIEGASNPFPEGWDPAGLAELGLALGSNITQRSVQARQRRPLPDVRGSRLLEGCRIGSRGYRGACGISRCSDGLGSDL